MMFPQRLKELLSVRGIAQIDLARRLGVTGQCVTRWIAGDAAPRGGRLESVAKVLDVSVPDLFAPLGTPVGAERVHAFDELLLIQMWRRMNPAERVAMLAAAVRGTVAQAEK